MLLVIMEFVTFDGLQHHTPYQAVLWLWHDNPSEILKGPKIDTTSGYM